MATFKDLLYSQEQQIKDLLPAYLTPQRFLVLAEQAYARQPALRECTPESVLACVMQAADLGLEINTPLGLAYLVPRRSAKTGRTHAALNIGYRGLIDRAIRAGGARDIIANVVRESDTFDYNPLDRRTPIIHKPDLSIDTDEEAGIVGAYSVAFLLDGDVKGEYMNRAALEKVRAKAETDVIYKGWPSEMFRKAPIRRLCKFLRMSGEAAEVQRFSKTLEYDNSLFEPQETVDDAPPPISKPIEIGGPAPSSDAQARAAAEKPRRGRPPTKPQEPQAPKKAAEVTPLSPAVAAPAPSDPQPESCGLCHDAEPPRGHTFNTCPRNRVDPDFREVEDDLNGQGAGQTEPAQSGAADRSGGGAAQAAAPNGRTLNDEEQAEIMRKAKLIRPRSSMGWLLGLIQRYGVDDLSMFPADKYEALLKTMDANA